MKLDDEQRKKVTGWIHDGLKLADIQKRISTELGLTMTYMDVRLLVDDLKLVPKDPEPAPVPPAPAAPTAKLPVVAGPGAKPETPTPASAPAAAPGGLLGGKVSVAMDTVARPGAMVSGSVTFSDGQRGSWYMDQYGRLGVAPEKQGYKPSATDVEAFQMELEKELAKFGY